MRRFSQLFAELDASTATGAKVEALKRYFVAAGPRDAAWAVYFLAGGKPRQVVPSGVLRALACRRAGIDDWLFDACYQAAGDLAETIAQVLPGAGLGSTAGLAEWVEQRLLPLRGLAPGLVATGYRSPQGGVRQALPPVGSRADGPQKLRHRAFLPRIGACCKVAAGVGETPVTASIVREGPQE